MQLSLLCAALAHAMLCDGVLGRAELTRDRLC